MFKKLFGKFKKTEEQAQIPFLEHPILQMSEYQGDELTIGNLCEGIVIFGGVGSGKTSGSGNSLANEFMRSDFGGLVLCAKNDEADRWLKLAKDHGRGDDVILFSSRSPHYFNFLDYECKREGLGAGQTENLVGLFLTIMEATKQGEGSSDQFFQDSAKDLMRNAIDLARLAGELISVGEIGDIINSAPMTAEQAKAPDLSKRCILLLKKVDDRLRAGELSDGDEHDYRQTFNYWTAKFPQMASKTRSGIIATYDALGSQFARGELYQRFCTKTTVRPEQTFDGKIIIMDYPIKEFGDVGLYAQVVFKTMWQQAIERRRAEGNTYPAFLWVDECQFFITTYDQEFLTTARSARAITVYLTQNVPNLLQKLGQANKAAVDSLLGNFQTKIFHQNSDVVTNEYASNLIGTAETTRDGYGSSSSESGASASFNTSTTRESMIHPNDFGNLRKGGPGNNFEVDAIVYQGGRRWVKTDQNFINVTFSQQ